MGERGDLNQPHLGNKVCKASLPNWAREAAHNNEITGHRHLRHANRRR